MDSDSIQLLLRNLGSLVAGFLISHGYADKGNLELIIGVFVGLGMVALSWWRKRAAAAEKAATAAVALALPSHADADTLNQALISRDLPPVELSK